MNSKTRFWLPSFADIFFCCCFLRLTLSSDSWLLNDADTGYHIRAGEYILHNFIVPRHDIFSYIAPPLPWVAHEWLSETIMALIHKFSGLTGIVIVFAFLIGLAYFLLFAFARALNCNLLLTALLVLLVTISSSLHWLARPHIFSLVLTVVWYAVLDNYQYKATNRLYLLPFLMALWVNLHGGFVVGFVLLAVFFAGNLVDFFFSRDQTRFSAMVACKRIAIVALVCLLASLLNPRGYSILLFPFNVVSNQFVMENVQEFLSPNFHESLPFKYLLLLTLGVLSLSRSGLNIIDFILVLLFSYMSLYSARYIPSFAIIVTPILLRRIQPMLQKFDNRAARIVHERSTNLELTDATTRGHLWPVISFLGVCVLSLNGKIAFKFDEMTKPVAAVEFLNREKLKGNMFNDEEFGDYVIYSAWPQYKVFFDGRSDMYGETWGNQYMKVATLQPDWQKVIDKNGFGWMFLPTGSSLSTMLLENKNWHLIYADKVAEIFVKDIPDNRVLINKYPDVKPSPPNA